MKNFPNNVFTIPGNHDLPNHKLDNIFNSSLNVLRIHNQNILVAIGPTDIGVNVSSDRFSVFGFPYGTEIKKIKPHYKGLQVAIIHTLVLSPDENEWFGGKGEHAKSILKKFPCYDLILTGHNHKSFVVEYEGRLLVNPGSMMRYKANQIDHKPRIYLWFDDNHVEEIFIPMQ